MRLKKNAINLLLKWYWADIKNQTLYWILFFILIVSNCNYILINVQPYAHPTQFIHHSANVIFLCCCFLAFAFFSRSFTTNLENGMVKRKKKIYVLKKATHTFKWPINCNIIHTSFEVEWAGSASSNWKIKYSANLGVLFQKSERKKVILRCI